MKRFLKTTLVVMLGLIAGLVAEAAPKKLPPNYTIVTTCGMVTDIVREVAGDKAKVQGLMGEGVDPHLYKPTRDDVAKLLQADVVFYSGLMLEGLPRRARRRRNHQGCPARSGRPVRWATGRPSDRRWGTGRDRPRRSRT